MANDALVATPLRGQDGLWRRITRVVADAEGRTRTTLVLAGPEGSGKTRILRELAFAARQAGHIVLTDLTLPGLDRDQDAASARSLAPARPLIGGGRLVLVLCDRPPLSPWQFDTMLGVSLLWVCTARSAAAGPILDGCSEVVGVPPLSANAVRELVGDLTDGTSLAGGATEIAALAAATAGNPGAIVELVRGIAEDRPGPLELPRRSRARISAQLHRTRPDTRDVVAVAAKLGRPFMTGEAARLLQLSILQAARAVDEAVACGLLVMDSGGLLAFPHEQVRAVVLHAMAPVVLSAVDSALVAYGESPAAQPEPPPALPEPDGVSPAEPPDCSLLTEQQLRIADLVAEGLTNRMIARRLHLSEYTVKYHLREIFKKLGISSRVQLAMRRPS